MSVAWTRQDNLFPLFLSYCSTGKFIRLPLYGPPLGSRPAALAAIIFALMLQVLRVESFESGQPLLYGLTL